MAKKKAKRTASKPAAEDKKTPSAKAMLETKAGKALVKAAKGRALYLKTAPKIGKRIGDDKSVEINLDVMPFGAYNVLKRAIADGDVLLLGGGK